MNAKSEVRKGPKGREIFPVDGEGVRWHMRGGVDVYVCETRNAEVAYVEGPDKPGAEWTVRLGQAVFWHRAATHEDAQALALAYARCVEGMARREAEGYRVARAGR